MQKYYFLTKCHKILQFFDSPIAIYKTHERWRDNHENGTAVPNSFFESKQEISEHYNF